VRNVVLHRAPIWCSTDLRDGNQALVNPMDRHESAVCSRFSSSSVSRRSRSGSLRRRKSDFDFVRMLVDEESFLMT